MRCLNDVNVTATVTRTYLRSPICSRMLTTILQLFERVNRNSNHVLEPYLPAKLRGFGDNALYKSTFYLLLLTKRECCYSLRSQSHERTLINKTTKLSKRDFLYIVRVLSYINIVTRLRLADTTCYSFTLLLFFVICYVAFLTTY